MSLSSEEEEELRRLEVKRARDDNVLVLIPGGKPSDDQVVSRLRNILRDAESGRFSEFVFVAIERDRHDQANIQWTGPAGFPMLGALQRALFHLSAR